MRTRVSAVVRPDLFEAETIRRSNDWVLAIIARLHTLISTRLSFGVAGLQAIQLGLEQEVVESIDLSDILGGHLELGAKMTQVLERIGLDA